MNLRRLLSGAVAIACLAALLATSQENPTDRGASLPSDATLSTSMEASMKAEQHWSLAQTSWSRTKVRLSNSRQSSFGFPVRIILTLLLIVSAIFAYSPNMPHMMEEVSSISVEKPRQLASAFLKSFSFEASNSDSTQAGISQPRRLANRFLQSLSFEAPNSKSNEEAAGRTVAHLRLRGIRHRVARLETGEEGLLDDDRDSAKINGYMSKAKAYAQRQQLEKADEFYVKAVHMAQGMLSDFKKDKTGPVEVDEAQHLITDAVMQSAAFYLEHGQVDQAKQVLDGASAVIEQHSDAATMRCRLLAANARRDWGDFSAAVADYEALLKKIPEAMEGASPEEKAMFNEIAAESQGEHARALLSEGAYADAKKLLETALEKLTASQQGPPTLLAARLKGWLAFAHLKEGNPKKAVELLDASLASIGDLPSGLAGATSEIQELLQSRAMAKAAIASLDGAADDLDVVRELQDELKKTISDEHNPEYSEEKGEVPDPRLWASMARTRTIAAEFKLLSNSGSAATEAMTLAKQARQLLREVKKSTDMLPKGYSLATFAEVKDLIARLQTKTSVAPSEQLGQDDSEEDAPTKPVTKEVGMGTKKADDSSQKASSLQ
mmetsp:Transcript_619/g.1053  ORF Transcript_619/g.1053 Transcript_619/m.1053 type:complete len:609 (+) Transcript_619:66-1892(+)